MPERLSVIDDLAFENTKGFQQQLHLKKCVC